jgi:hypothetical protein
MIILKCFNSEKLEMATYEAFYEKKNNKEGLKRRKN